MLMGVGLVHVPFTFVLIDTPASAFPFDVYLFPKRSTTDLPSGVAALTELIKFGYSLLNCVPMFFASVHLPSAPSSEYQISSLSFTPPTLPGWFLRLKYNVFPSGERSGFN